MNATRSVILVAVSAACLALPAEALATRYVTPAGTPAGDCQTVATACDLQTAIEGAGGNFPSPGEEVIVEPGSYSLAALVTEGASDLNIHGVLGQPRPVINQTAPAGQLQIANGTLSYLDLEGGGTNLVNQSGGLMDRVVIRGAGNGNFTCQCYGGTIRDSVFVSRAQTAALGVTSNGGTSALTLRNVTAISTDSTGSAITIGHSNPGAVSYDAYNVIARNTTGGTDVAAFGPNATITFHHSNYGNAVQMSGGAVVDAPGDPHQSAAPLFADAAAGDFSEGLGSPTIDAGLADPANGPLDFAGNPRSFGGGTDIGAYEFVPPTTFSLGATTVKIKRSGEGLLPFSCTTPAPDRCDVAASLSGRVKKKAGKAKTATIGQVSGSVASGTTASLLVQLTKAGRKALLGKRKLGATLTGTVANSLGTTVPLSGTLTLKPAKRKR